VEEWRSRGVNAWSKLEEWRSGESVEWGCGGGEWRSGGAGECMNGGREEWRTGQVEKCMSEGAEEWRSEAGEEMRSR